MVNVLVGHFERVLMQIRIVCKELLKSIQEWLGEYSFFEHFQEQHADLVKDSH